MDKREKITAREGMILTDGMIYGAEIFLADGRSADDFHEITREEYEAKLAEDAQAHIDNQ